MNIYEKPVTARWEWEDMKGAQKRLGPKKYVFDNENWFCSSCGYHRSGRYAVDGFKFCPNCGERMENA